MIVTVDTQVFLVVGSTVKVKVEMEGASWWRLADETERAVAFAKLETLKQKV